MAAVLLTSDSSPDRLLPLLVAGSPVLAASPSGGFGNALTFSGVDAGADTDAALLYVGALLVGSGPFSIEVRVTRARSGVTEKILGQWHTSEGNYLLYFSSDNKINFGFQKTVRTFQNLASSSTITDTATHVIEASWDGTNVRLFVDGTLERTLAFSTTIDTTRFNPFFVGRGDTTNDAFNGTIDELRISSVARNIASYTPANSPYTADADTIALWHFDDVAANDTHLQRVGTTPVLAKGGTYGGFTADALAAPAYCFDGDRFVLQVSAWNVATSKWATLYFVSDDFAFNDPWTYVSGSLKTPGGSDYIYGNGGIEWWNGKYWRANNHYGFALEPSGITIEWSTDLISWTQTVDLGIDAYGGDPDLVANPITENLECWYLNSSRQVCMSDSADGTTWTPHGVQYVATFNATNFGEPSVFYDNGFQYLTFDGGTVSGHRSVQLVRRPIGDTIWSVIGEVLTHSSDAWENVQVFDDSCKGRFDTGDGNGAMCRFLYAGGDIAGATDNTNSSIGAAFLNPLGVPSQPTVGEVEPTESGINVPIIANDIDEEVSSYTLERQIGAGAFVAIHTGPFGDYPILDTGTTVGDSVTCRLKAKNATGDSSYSVTVTVTSQGPLQRIVARRRAGSYRSGTRTVLN